MKVTDLQDQLAEVLMNLPGHEDPPLTMDEFPLEIQEEFRKRAKKVMAFFEELMENAVSDDETIVVHKISDYGIPMVELTRRNLTVLLEKLDNPDSARTLIDGGNKIAVKAVEDEEHYAKRPPGEVHMPGRPAL